LVKGVTDSYTDFAVVSCLDVHASESECAKTSEREGKRERACARKREGGRESMLTHGKNLNSKLDEDVFNRYLFSKTQAQAQAHTQA